MPESTAGRNFRGRESLFCADRARFSTMEDSAIRVLVVDDHPEMVRRISRFVDFMPGVSCVGAVRDGRAAVEAAMASDPDVILMDLRMPVMDGIEATRRIVAAGLRARVIALTSLEDDDSFHRALRAGVSGFMLKSSSRGEIAHAIQRVHEGESMLSATLITRVLTRYGSNLDHTDQIAHLTDREVALLALVGRGLSNDQIAQELDLSPATVKSYVSRLLIRVTARDRAQLVVLAHRTGVVTL